MNFKYGACILFVCSLLIGGAYASSANAALLEIYPGTTVTEKRVLLKAEDRIALKKVLKLHNTIPRIGSLFEVSMGEEGVIAYATEQRMMGKHAEIRILVVSDPKFGVASVRVLRHREQHGRGIEKRTFLGQFRAKKVSDKWRLGYDIDGITGATISSTAMLKGVHDGLHMITLLVKE
jgi:Na+-translocating ferredoxin:NAD+ oxidoreductase RnfG subunit